MAETDSAAPDGRAGATKAAPKPAVAANDQAELTIEALAQGILSREVRPRTSDIRRLAEAVLTGVAAKKPKKAKAGVDGKDKPDKKAAKKKKKLAKIPGHKAKK